jgi:hypothetical protein
VSRWRPRLRRTRSARALGLDSRELAWLRDGSSTAGSIASAVHDDGVTQALRDAAAAEPVDIVAAPDVAQHWLQVPPSSVRSLGELRQVAAARCAHLYGGVPEDWWVTGDWHARRPFACAALPRSLVATIARELDARASPVRWRTTWTAACSAFAGEFPSDGWSALAGPERAVLWHCRNGDINCVATLALDPLAAASQTAERVLQRIEVEALRCGETPSATVHWLDLAGREEASSTPGVHWISCATTGAEVPRSEAAAALRLHQLTQRRTP